jgi:hypothetical protein
MNGSRANVSSTANVLRKLHLLVGETRCRLYDWRHDVRTCGDVTLAGLEIVGGSVEHGAPYVPSHPRFLYEILRTLDIDFSRYHFVDLGSGKGRVLLVASEFPFQRIVGVEFASELHAIAVDNVKRYRSATQRCRDIACIHGDAMKFSFPDAPIILFMYNPFGPAVMVPVLRNLQQSIERNPRDVILLYAAPFHGQLVEQETSLRRVATGRYHNTYRVAR